MFSLTCFFFISSIPVSSFLSSERQVVFNDQLENLIKVRQPILRVVHGGDGLANCVIFCKERFLCIWLPCILILFIFGATTTIPRTVKQVCVCDYYLCVTRREFHTGVAYLHPSPLPPFSRFRTELCCCFADQSCCLRPQD